MLETSQILFPVAALVVWSMVMCLWTIITRVPAIIKAKMRLDPNLPRGEQMSQLPAQIRWKADNYNNLMEQPTLFYAVAIVLALTNEGHGVNLMLAWCYVVLRILHSLVQATCNIIKIRFAFFLISTLVLAVMSVNAFLFFCYR